MGLLLATFWYYTKQQISYPHTYIRVDTLYFAYSSFAILFVFDLRRNDTKATMSLWKLVFLGIIFFGVACQQHTIYANRYGQFSRRIFRSMRRIGRGGEAPSNFTLQDTLQDDSDDDDYSDDEDSSSKESKAILRSLWSRFVPKLESTQFLDRIAMVATSLLQREDSSLEEEQHMAVYNETFLHQITPQSDLTRPGRYIHVVTTAALPWFTGTAVNPLLRAAYLYRRTQDINRNHCNNNTLDTENDPRSWVILVIPWLELREDQELLYGQVFANTTQQELYIRDWLRKEANMPDVADHLEIVFYPARYHTGLRSIFAMGDMMNQLDHNKMDVAILEEPEHVNCKWNISFCEGFLVLRLHLNYFPSFLVYRVSSAWRWVDPEVPLCGWNYSHKYVLFLSLEMMLIL